MHELETPNTNNTVPTTSPMNRAQRRAMEKKRKRAQTKQNRMIANYIKKHPEAIQFNIDEDKIAELENSEEEINRGKRALTSPIDEACIISEEEAQEKVLDKE